jgi:hypothetical protein
MPEKNLPRDITSYDLVKSAAVLLMIGDHIGAYFAPQDLWWRAFGRLCVPAWFFLIGYARSRDMGPRMWAGMAFLLLMNFAVGYPILPVNILGAMLVMRFFIDPVMGRAVRGQTEFWGAMATMFFLAIPTGMLVEYGSLGIILAGFGWLARRQDEIPDGRRFAWQALFFSLFSYILYQFMDFGFRDSQTIFMATGSALVMAGLFCFRPQTYPALTARLPSPVVSFIRLLGRRSLEIYVLHLTIFKIAGLLLFPDRFHLFHFQLIEGRS